MTLVKAILGLCLGLALFSMLQTVGMHALQDYIKSGAANAGLPNMNTPVVTGFDADALKNGILPKYGPIDTSEGQRLAIEGAARRIDIETRNALSHVPVPGRFGR
jgi:hypothetical protein